MPKAFNSDMTAEELIAAYYAGTLNEETENYVLEMIQDAAIEAAMFS